MAGKVYVYYGDETYLIDQALHALRHAHVDPAMEAFGYQLLEGAQAFPDAVVNAVQTIPSFTPERFVVLKNPSFLGGRKNNDDDSVESSTEDAGDAVVNALTDLPDGVFVAVVVYGSIDLRKKIGKFLKKQAVEMTEFKSFDRWDRQEVVEWIIRQVTTAQYQIDQDTAHFIAEIAGHGLGMVHNELDKIMLYCGKDKKITIDKIKEVISPGELSLLDMAEALRRKDMVQVMTLLGRLAKDGEKSHSITGFVVSQVRFLLQLKELQDLKRSPDEIAQAVKKHPFYVRKILQDLNRFSLKELATLYYALQDGDYKSKTGQLDGFVALELALVELKK